MAAAPSFVELSENRLAVHATARLARCVSRGTPFPLVLLHGPPGTGKTHLAESLVCQVVHGPAVRTVQSLPATEMRFSSDTDVDFTDLGGVDLLVIEDVHQLAPAGAPLLSRLLDERQRRRRPTLLTASAGPARFKKLPRRLTDRLSAGLVIALEPYSTASRKTLLIHHAAEKNLALDAAALDWLAARPTGGSLRPLLGLLDTLKAQHRGRTISLDALKLLGSTDALGVETIVARVAETFGVKTKELLGPSRLRAVLLPRQVAMFLARDLALLSLPRIGAHFGGRDHTTVSHAVNKIRTAIAGDRQLAGTIRQLRIELA